MFRKLIRKLRRKLRRKSIRKFSTLVRVGLISRKTLKAEEIEKSKERSQKIKTKK